MTIYFCSTLLSHAIFPHWSGSNILGVGLGSCVYLWNAASSKVTKLCDLAKSVHANGAVGDTVTSVCWNPKGSMVAIGTNRGVVEVWDVEQERKIRDLTGHESRVGSIAWSGDTLTTGSRDRSIHLRDTRAPHPSFAALANTLTAHRQEVCGLKWSVDDTLLASGGNDNRLLVWDRRALGSAGAGLEPLHTFREHAAAVKAIAWSPHCRGLLASGGGTADQKIRFWRTSVSGSGAAVGCWNTQSQVCNLAWSQKENEVVSTHGFSQNQVVVWKVEGDGGGDAGVGISPLATLTGHTMRVLYLAVSPDNQNIVTGAGDETLRFWSVFGKVENVRKDEENGAGGLTIR
ncbi:WD40-repeat-containing domain protein [Chytriomyces sp. MP71]|nr:WD40-repeat-containing domain protein [Chytriomyces sp. MP71]